MQRNYMQTWFSTVGPPSLPCSLDADQEFGNRDTMRIPWLVDIQIDIVTKAGERNLVAAGNVEAELAET
jgi:hypothetical protein